MITGIFCRQGKKTQRKAERASADADAFQIVGEYVEVELPNGDGDAPVERDAKRRVVAKLEASRRGLARSRRTGRRSGLRPCLLCARSRP
jgi:hypothetical protein